MNILHNTRSQRLEFRCRSSQSLQESRRFALVSQLKGSSPAHPATSRGGLTTMVGHRFQDRADGRGILVPAAHCGRCRVQGRRRGKERRRAAQLAGKVGDDRHVLGPERQPVHGLRVVALAPSAGHAPGAFGTRQLRRPLSPTSSPDPDPPSSRAPGLPPQPRCEYPRAGWRRTSSSIRRRMDRHDDAPAQTPPGPARSRDTPFGARSRTRPGHPSALALPCRSAGSRAEPLRPHARRRRASIFTGIGSVLVSITIRRSIARVGELGRDSRGGPPQDGNEQITISAARPTSEALRATRPPARERARAGAQPRRRSQPPRTQREPGSQRSPNP